MINYCSIRAQRYLSKVILRRVLLHIAPSHPYSSHFKLIDQVVRGVDLLSQIQMMRYSICHSLLYPLNANKLSVRLVAHRDRRIDMPRDHRSLRFGPILHRVEGRMRYEYLLLHIAQDEVT